ncbi:hypothetical protein H4R18_001255 [Coemansia javaensis]|uniref:Uncharacterized protein n=1 Tax=Coemansia javaensis TaxID=2761396 RepID=A0A9W8HFQ0_9FUNG|nr:hypothetical protein H4R18_001255 [Coemansia javaensis]
MATTLSAAYDGPAARGVALRWRRRLRLGDDAPRGAWPERQRSVSSASIAIGAECAPPGAAGAEPADGGDDDGGAHSSYARWHGCAPTSDAEPDGAEPESSEPEPAAGAEPDDDDGGGQSGGGGGPGAGLGAGGAGDVAAVAQIFQVGQAQQRAALRRGAARVQRAVQRAGLAAARIGRGWSGGWSGGWSWSRSQSQSQPQAQPQSHSQSHDWGAAVQLLAADAALGRAVRLLGGVRSTRSAAFQHRAARVHRAQARALRWLHALFAAAVAPEQRQSRHYRVYLPEDDQAELDRGFSESVLFAAQALAHGLQIRGTERHTRALAAPALVLCAAWAAVRFAVRARRRALTRPCAAADPDAAALRRALADFDAAWVRFERDLCFAYFGLGDADADAGAGAGAAPDPVPPAHEAEFALLVVLLSEALAAARAAALLADDLVDAMDPRLFLALPRLAILQAIADAPADDDDALCFVGSGARPVFWWFRDHAAACRRIRDAVAFWPAARTRLLQRMLAADEADLVLAQAEPASIIDSPRSARSLSIDGCISSFFSCSHASLPTTAAPALPVLSLRHNHPPLSLASTHSLSPTTAAASPCDLSDAEPDAEPNPNYHHHHHHHRWPAALPPVPPKYRARQIAACRDQVRQVFVDVCSVADSLHSGPFARPFRLALEMVFTAADDPR